MTDERDPAPTGGATNGISQTMPIRRMRTRLLYGIWTGWLALACVTIGVLLLLVYHRTAVSDETPPVDKTAPTPPSTAV